jgi:hypothetical protein
MSSTKSPLSRLVSVAVREYWGHEALEFTPWLAQKENLDLLAQALELTELEVEGTEQAVGPFRADILCREVGSEGLVLIENQLERTDHSHLGQILTYAAGLGASKVVWVAPSFTEEHRAALDWLNRITHEDFHCFGVQVELWRIGDSALAPRFHVVAKPNDWEKRVKAQVHSTSGANTERAKALRDFWDGLFEYLDAHGSPFRLVSRKGTAGTWLQVADTVPGLRLLLSFGRQGGLAKVWVLFRSRQGRFDEEAMAWFQFVYERREVLGGLQGITWHTARGDEFCQVLRRVSETEEPAVVYAWFAQAVPPIVRALGELWPEFLDREAGLAGGDGARE